MKKITIFIIATILPFITFSQENEKSDFGINWSGFVRNDMIFNTRQVVSARGENQFLLAPKSISLDANGDDINAVPNLNIIGLITRLKGKITGPDAFGAKTSGYIEADFYGKSTTTSFGLRMRHAFMKLKWESVELLTGQYWNPAFVTDCYPGTVSFGAGVPFNPLSRNPQIRLTKSFGKIKIVASAMSQGHFVSKAGAGTAMNAVIPETHWQIQYANKKDNGTGLYAGAGFFRKTLMPRTTVDATDNSTGDALIYKTDTKVSGISALAYTKVVLKAITIKAYGMYGQMNDNMVMMGGYAYQIESTTASGITTDEYTYSPYNTLSTWVDIHTNGKKIETGAFIGYNKNLGISDNIAAADIHTVGRWTNVESMIRVAPRVVFKSGKMKFGVELEYSLVNYGSIEDNGAVENTEPADNIKALISATYNF